MSNGMARHRDLTLVGLTVALAVMLAVHPLLPGWAVNTIGLSLANGLVVLGLLVLMRAGLVSFGQGLFFGLGGYAAAMAGVKLGISDFFVLLIFGAAVSGGVAFALGFLTRRYRGIFFAMLNMAFSMILFGILVKSAELGSTDGFSVAPPTFFGFAPDGGETRLTFLLYALTCLLAYGCAVAVHRYLNATLGFIGEGIRENEVRVEYLGASVEGAIHTKYVIAAIVSGIGGVLTALLIGHVTPEDFTYWTKSGEFVFVAILSGTGNVAAPFIGAIIFELVRTYALQYAPGFWQMLLGSTLLLVIVFLPGGLWSIFSRLGAARAS